MARQFSRWSGIPFVGLRFSNVMERADYERFPAFWEDPHLRKWNLWSYVDESHVAESVGLALVADIGGAEAFVIAAADTVMKRPSRELMAQVFPGVRSARRRRQRHAARDRQGAPAARLLSRRSAGAKSCNWLRVLADAWRRESP